jgi:putative transposase
MLDVQPSGKATMRFWQPGGGFDRNIFSLRELHEKIGYIHKNPVRRKLVAQPVDWLWSSYRAWTTGQGESLPIDRGTLPPQ